MKQVIKISLWVVAAMLLLPFLSYPQSNIVLNGAFETLSGCPNDYDFIRYTPYWDDLDTNYGSTGDSAFRAIGIGRRMEPFPEYCNFCGTPGRGGAPRQAKGFQYPRSGAGMAAMVFFMDRYSSSSSIMSSEGQNYLQGRLATTLLTGRQYCVTFYVSRASYAEYAIDRIGVYLDDGSIDTTSHPAIAQTHCTPQVLDTVVRYDTLNWMKIQGSFRANGTEKFITIGMFFDSSHFRHISTYTDARGDTVPRRLYAYYFVDDVSVLPSDARAYAGRDTIIMHPGDTARLGVASGGDGVPAYWYRLGSGTAIDSGGTIFVHPTTTTSYVVRLDLCGASTFDTVKVWVYPDTPQVNGVALLNTEKLALYPNPAREVLTISGGHGCTFTLCNLMGQEVIRTPLTRPLQDVPLSGIPPGVYLAYITDGAGNKIVKRVVLSEL